MPYCLLKYQRKVNISKYKTENWQSQKEERKRKNTIIILDYSNRESK